MSTDEARPVAHRFPTALRRYFQPHLLVVALPWDALFATVIWFVFANVLVMGIVSSFPGDRPDLSLVATAILNPLLFLGTLFLLLWLGPDLARSLGLGREVPRAFLLGILHCLLWFPLVFTVNAVVSLFVPERPAHPALRALESADAAMMAVLWIAVVVTAPLWEELLFRGIFQTGFFTLTRRGSAPDPSPTGAIFFSWIAVLLAAVVFGWAHASQWPDPVPLVILGVGLGLSFAYTRSLWTPIAFHATFNGLMLGLALLAM